MDPGGDMVDRGLDLDSHADMAVLGSNCYIFEETGRSIDVYSYDPKLGSSERKVVSGVFAYDDPTDGRVNLLIVHQGLHIPHLKYSLIPPFQMRENDITVNERPKFQCANPGLDDHAILIERENHQPYRLPLSLRGTTSYLDVRCPTQAEIDDITLDRFELTYSTPDWDPGSPRYSVMESRLEEDTLRSATGISNPSSCIRRVEVTERSATSIYEHEASQSAAILSEINPLLCDDWLAQALRETRNTSNVSSIHTSEKFHGITAETLARNWSIPLERAKRTLTVTTQKGIKARPTEMTRRFKTNDRMLRYNRLATNMFTDTMQSGTLSRRQNKYAQVFVIPPNWTKVYAMRTKGEAHHCLSSLFHDVGVPEKMIMDGSKEQTQGEFRKKLRDAGCIVHQTEPYTPWSDRAELAIRELKRKTRRQMVASNCPKRLWDDCIELVADINAHTVHENFGLDGQTPQALITGNTPDISSLAEFRWYQWIKWFNENADLPEDQEVYGRYLGPSRSVGSLMTSKILNEKGNILHRSSFRSLTRTEEDNPEEKIKRRTFDQTIGEILGPNMQPEDIPEDETPEHERYEEEDGTKTVIEDRDEIDQQAIDMYLHAEVLLPIAGEMLTGRVVRRKRDADGNLIGKSATNPFLDTRMYVVSFPDDREAEYAANIIAENMLSMCDAEGNQYVLMKHIIDHRKENSAVHEKDSYIWIRGRKTTKKTTKGWKFCVEWRDGTSSWEPLSALKESNPVEVAEYAIAHGLVEEPAFRWWVPYTLKKRDAIISAVNKRYAKRTHKYGIRVPKSVEEAFAIDKDNGDNRWAESIQKEMNNVRVAFNILEEGKEVPPGYQYMKCHLVFDVKFDGFKFKSRMVAGGHMVDTPPFLTYASVVSRDSVRIALLMAALHDLDVKVADVENAYLTAPTTEKVWTICGPEFGPDEGRKAIICRALYGLKGSGASYRNHIADCMRHLGYEPCRADPDLWMVPKTRDDGFEYYSYVLIYVDDILAVSHEAMNDLRRIDFYFRMKKESIGDPDIYLGSKLRKVTMPNGVEAWMISPTKYIREAIKSVERHLEKEYGSKLPKRVSGPLPTGYRPEMDITQGLEGDESSYYQSQIGVLRWMVELGRIDIITEVSSLASCLALPRRGHLEALFHIYAYLKKKSNGTIILDPTYPDIDLSQFNDGAEWSNFYGDVREVIPTNMPKPRGKTVVVKLFVDSDHAADQLTRRSRTGFILYLNKAPIVWFSKRQGTIETSVFGAEFVSMRTGIEAGRALRYKLRMMGIPIEEPMYCYGDNMSVIHNTQKPESTLKKKSNSICYHFCREAVAMGEVLTAHVRSEDNPADICTKLIPGGIKRDKLCDMLLHYYDGSEENG
jgi:Reverse transcriptase (RNA-dependent DNA polymerase)